MVREDEAVPVVDPAAPADRRRSAALARRRAREHEIITATRALFDARGVRDAQIEDVAKAVGVNRAIIYRHFSGKEELFALTLVGYLDDLNAALHSVPTDLPPTERLRQITIAFVDFGLDHPAFVDCAQKLMRHPGPELLEEVSESALFRLGRGISACLAVLTDVFVAGNESGDFDIPDVDLLANAIYASGLGALQLARVGMVVKEAAPGIPMVAPLSAEQVKDYLIDNAQRLTVKR